MSELPFAEASERNKQPILEALKEVLPDRGRVLEIGSGTGQHVVYFAPALPELSWQPSDLPEYLEGLGARIRQEGAQNILDAIGLDVTGTWPRLHFNAVYSSNTAHIMSWDAVRAMISGVGGVLSPGGVFCLYGPFNEDGKFTAASNEDFDRGLRARDPSMGIREREALELLARRQQMKLVRQFRLPANNSLLVFQKAESNDHD